MSIVLNRIADPIFRHSAGRKLQIETSQGNIIELLIFNSLSCSFCSIHNGFISYLPLLIFVDYPPPSPPEVERHKLSVSTQSLISFGKTFLRVSALIWKLAQSSVLRGHLKHNYLFPLPNSGLYLFIGQELYLHGGHLFALVVPSDF